MQIENFPLGFFGLILYSIYTGFANLIIWGVLFSFGTKIPAAVLARFVGESFSTNDESHYKNLDLLSSQRRALFYFLVLILVLIWVAVGFLLNNNIVNLLQLASFQLVGLGLYFFLKSYRKIDVNIGENKNLKQLSRAIDVVSQTYGKMPIRPICIYSKAPTLFLQKENGELVLKATSSLLNLLNQDELTAVVAHEYVLLEEGAFGFRNRNQIMSALVLSSLCVLVVAVLLSRLVTSEEAFLFVTFGVPLAIYVLVLFYDFFEYLIRFKEIYFADISSVSITRYPKALHSALTKIYLYRSEILNLPFWVQPFLLTAEVYKFYKLLPYQPRTNKRLDLLEQVYGLNFEEALPKNDSVKACPSCRGEMKEFEYVNSQSISSVYLYCEKCDRYWFDLYKLGTVELGNFVFQKKSEGEAGGSDEGGGQECPVCGVSLERMHFVVGYAPVWTCRSCGGNSIKGEELCGLLNYRNTAV